MTLTIRFMRRMACSFTPQCIYANGPRRVAYNCQTSVGPLSDEQREARAVRLSDSQTTVET